jgi:hypothetical protein
MGRLQDWWYVAAILFNYAQMKGYKLCKSSLRAMAC